MRKTLPGGMHEIRLHRGVVEAHEWYTQVGDIRTQVAVTLCVGSGIIGPGSGFSLEGDCFSINGEEVNRNLLSRAGGKMFSVKTGPVNLLVQFGGGFIKCR